MDAEGYAVAYGHAAAAYHRVLDPTLAPVARGVVALAGVDAGTRLLDLATGTGAIARAAHALGASVVGVDVAPGMIAAARAASPPAIEFLVADAVRLPFADASFAVVTCGFALSHLADVPAALAGVRRVLRHDGRLVASAWGGDGENPASAAVRAELERSAGRAAAGFAETLDERTWADVERASHLLAGAGFRVDVVSEPLHGRFASARAAVEWTLAWPAAGEAVAALPPVERHRLEEAALAAAAGADLAWRYTVNYFVAERRG